MEPEARHSLNVLPCTMTKETPRNDDAQSKAGGEIQAAPMIRAWRHAGIEEKRDDGHPVDIAAAMESMKSGATFSRMKIESTAAS